MTEEQRLEEENIADTDEKSVDLPPEEAAVSEDVAEETSDSPEVETEVEAEAESEGLSVEDSEETVDEPEEAVDESEETSVEDSEEPGDESKEAVGELEAEKIEEPEEAPRPDGTEWYVIHSYSGYENKVQKNLYHRIESMDMQDRIFQVVVPTEEEVELRDGKRRTIERRVFPGYILVEMLLDEDSWYVVRNTPGVTGFVGSGSKPTPLRKEEVDKIIKRMDAEVPKIKVSFKVGQKVRIVEGPFEDFTGTVDEIDVERARVKVLVNFFGRETPIELDFLQVERV